MHVLAEKILFYYTKVLKQHNEQAMVILADILQNSLFEEESIKKS